MIKLKLINPAQPLSEDDLIDFEREFEIKIPARLRQHYLKENGGFPDCHKMYYVPKGVDPCDANGVTFNGFYPIKYTSTPDGSTLEANYTSYTDDQKLFEKDEYIPFGFDVSGFPLLMKFSGCAIYLLDRDEVDDDDREVIKFIAPSLQDFIDGLMPGDDFEKLMEDC
ncbi:SMI1/KNR4 family protein [Paraburkholderia flava]|uniref:SMI1/KNR4 family protein n=1 Tax=Paraburkholderia flava TaxID=2547393 RepID=UPI00105F098B|nr:SMI1/KNR4 family protein [Paraburkholderia flava]